MSPNQTLQVTSGEILPFSVVKCMRNLNIFESIFYFDHSSAHSFSWSLLHNLPYRQNGPYGLGMS